MRTIIALVGASGCGKTTLSLHLEPEFATVVSYTTRPMREGEENGREHWFVSEKAMPPQHLMLAYTKFGNYHYWASKCQIPHDRPACYVIDEKGLITLIGKHAHEFRIVPVYIKRDDLECIEETRRKRDMDRQQLPDDFYKAIIYNNGTLEEFLNNATKIIKNLIRNGSTEE